MAEPPTSALAPKASTLFVKVDRVRRLQPCHELTATLLRGDDGTFGLVLTDDNEIASLSHATNAHACRPADQVLRVGDCHLGRERLGDVLAEKYADASALEFRLARPVKDAHTEPSQNDVFVILSLVSPNGRTLREMTSDLWLARTNSVWGACWTLPLPPAAAALRVSLHNSFLLTDPLVGSVEIPLESLLLGDLACHWFQLRAARGHTIEGELLLNLRRFHVASSVSPDFGAPSRRHGLFFFDIGDESDFDGDGFVAIAPEQHTTEPLPLVIEPRVGPDLQRPVPG